MVFHTVVVGFPPSKYGTIDIHIVFCIRQKTCCCVPDHLVVTIDNMIVETQSLAMFLQNPVYSNTYNIAQLKLCLLV